MMNKFVKSAALLFPPVRTRYEQLNNLRNQVEDLNKQNEALKAQCEQIHSEATLEQRLRIIETRLDCPAERIKEVFITDEELPYKVKIKQGDLSDSEQHVFSAARIIQGVENAPYIPTYSFNGDYINESHKFFANCERAQNQSSLSLDIEGWLYYQEALKIYELAYFSPSNVLEIGTYKGLSASIILQAIRDSSRGVVLDTVDINTVYVEQAKKNLENKFGEISDINFHLYDGNNLLDIFILENKKYGFIFLDGGHGYKNVYKNAIRLNRLLLPGGFALFHDYADRRNFQNDSCNGVYQAVHDALLTNDRFAYSGVFGRSVLFRYLG
jgi:hypothetical protein